MYHFYNDCPAVLRARQVLINAYQHPDIVVNFNQAALYPLRAVDPYLLAFLAFPFPSSPAFSKDQLRFFTDFVLIFNWCAWDIRKEAKSDPSMVDPSCPDRIVNKIVMLTISTLNRFYKSKGGDKKFPVVKDLTQGPIQAPRRDFQDDPRPFPPSSFPANNRPIVRSPPSLIAPFMVGHDPPGSLLLSLEDEDHGPCDDWEHDAAEGEILSTTDPPFIIPLAPPLVGHSLDFTD